MSAQLCEDCSKEPAVFELRTFETFVVNDLSTDEEINSYEGGDGGSKYWLCKPCIEKRGNYLD